MVDKIRQCGGQADTVRLPAGDYSWLVTDDEVTRSVHVVVERKSMDDLLHSVADGRLQRFVEETGGMCPSGNLLRAVLIEGDKAYSHAWSSDAIDNLRAELQAGGVIVISSDGLFATPTRIVSFWRWTGKHGHRTLLAPILPKLDPRVYLDAESRAAVGALMGILGPGWGEDRCRAALAQFGAPGEVVREVLEDGSKLLAVPGVGKGLIKKAKEFMARRVNIYE